MSGDGIINSVMLKQQSGEFDLESIYVLKLRELGLTDLGNIGECTALEKLDLSRNQLRKLYVISSLLNLVHLDLSSNLIQFADGLQTLEKLTFLNLAGNLIENVEALNCLFGLENLQELRLKDNLMNIENPLCNSCTYKSDIMTFLPTLQVLDGEKICGAGSDLYQLFNSLDSDLKALKEQSKPIDSNYDSLLQIKSDYFHLDEKFLNVDLELLDYEKALHETLRECSDLLQKH